MTQGSGETYETQCKYDKVEAKLCKLENQSDTLVSGTSRICGSFMAKKANGPDPQ